jgi:hypothetical protein
MGELQLRLTAEEQEFLVGLLERTLKDARVEEHRTRTPSYREHVLHREELIAELLSKLAKQSA